jgi:hypothetical protein
MFAYESIDMRAPKDIDEDCWKISDYVTNLIYNKKKKIS